METAPCEKPMPKPARKPPRKRAPGRPGKDARRCLECANCKPLWEISQKYYRDWLVRGQELADKQREIKGIRAHLVTWKRVTHLIFNQAMRRHLDAIALANSLPRNQAPAPRPWWKRVWFKLKGAPK